MKIVAIIGLAVIVVTGSHFGAVPVLTGSFTDHDRLWAAMDNRPADVILALETRLTQRQIDDIEAELWPVPEPDEIRATLVETKRFLMQRRIPADDVTVKAIQDRINSIPGPTTEARQ